ncbi:streptogramin lyase [Actinoalloteichus hoggarensis]|uniref:Pyrrolo-quinoline quinone repeat domain-containing protein n=1 Tax=Actinoalloteichus hoggarensis TaxID=1470176 RepID=A0A221W518_9PSEU|nr:PQQ-binding-like beta-propeller repeat protein [Actinoalloteichus hoggarensis]ASO20965.1 hypothetical protein AHOG_16695 [Actinoalloteichus hoggarensis]MBB5920896.1 streptogramin lyase [Actinoalloteichus hoggarensis]
MSIPSCSRILGGARPPRTAAVAVAALLALSGVAAGSTRPASAAAESTPPIPVHSVEGDSTGPSRLSTADSVAPHGGESAAHRTASADASSVVSLGTPMLATTTIGGAVGVAEDGTPEIYTVSSRDDDMGVFSVLHGDTGAVKHSIDLGRGAHSYGVAVAPDGGVWIATTSTGRLLRWEPGSDDLADHGRLFASESHLYKLAFDDAGVVYGGTYPNGKAFRYDPATAELRDYGTVADGQSYVRSVGLYGDTLYAGTQPHAHLVAIDVDSGDRAEVALPEGTDLDQVVYDVNVVGDRLFVRVTKTGLNGTLLVRDLINGEWLAEFPGVSGLDVTPVAEDGRVYFSQNGVLTGYDVTTGETAATGLVFPYTAQLRSLGLGSLADPEFPGQSVLGLLLTGDVFWFNPETGAHRIFASDIELNPVRMRSLAEGPDGSVLTGGTGTGAFAMVDGETGDVLTSERFSEVMGMLTTDDGVYLGAYPRGRVYAWDRDRPWEWANIDDGGKVNPAEVYNGDDSFGDRTFALVEAGPDTIAVGTVNKSGYLGGSLVLHDTVDGTSEVHSDLVADQSVMALAYRDGVLYVGTSVYGGYGAVETETDARLLAWDVENGEKLWETIPVAGERTVSDLTFDGEGRLWGVTAGLVFQVDPEDGTLLGSQRHAAYSWPVDGGYALADLDYNAVDGDLYASMPGVGLARIDAADGSLEVLTDRGVYRMFVHSSGDVFANDGAELLRYRPS